ncbi:ankyrin repeat-containing domain protein [Aspergillus pseudotamarii]|uniref:Ankyrin repeat-containing domain protein n=1 Tax=Aspergillus pseudotamarii TaxID=132259 RepID=A0A5N6ST61_ASPPS|nr:ankyrin repeat-containing domain protein [Aspergillus pseudotamarii]KAE8137009.1 ankyrin repeat-containing domain protein [Aspergillus pseudotamarii]
MLAAVCGHKEVVELLFHHGADINRIVGDVCTPLLGAIGHGHVDVVEYLLVNGADLEVELGGYFQYNALELAAHEGHVEVVKTLLRHGADPNKSSPLALATGMGRLEATRVLIEAGADIGGIAVDNVGTNAFFNAVYHGKAAVVSLLIEYGVSPEYRDNDGMTPLAYAAYYRRDKVIEVLLNHGANVNALVYGFTALSFAIDEGKVPAVKLLLENGADLTMTNEPFLLRTLKRSHNQEADTAIVELLLNHRADPNCCDRKGRTPLFLATVKQHLDIMRLLLVHGANPDREDEKIDLLSWAFLKGHEDISLSIYLENLKMAEEFISAPDLTSWTIVLPRAPNASVCQSPTMQSSHDTTQPPEYYYHVYKFGEPDQASLECLSQELPASDDDEMLDDESDFDGEEPLPSGESEYFPGGYTSRSQYEDDNMIDDSVSLDTSSCSSIASEGSECGMKILDESDIKDIKTRTLMAIPIYDFMNIKRIRSMIDNFTQQQLVDAVRKVLEVDKFKVNQQRVTTYRITYSHPSLELRGLIQRHLVKEVPCPDDERATNILSFDDLDNSLHEKSNAQLKQLLGGALSEFHTAKLYAILEEQIQALPEETREQIHTEARRLFDESNSQVLWG